MVCEFFRINTRFPVFMKMKSGQVLEKASRTGCNGVLSSSLKNSQNLFSCLSKYSNLFNDGILLLL
jgi:hypothetical protein